MKAGKLAAAALACGLAWALLVGGVAVAESTSADTAEPICVEEVAEDVEGMGDTLQQDAESAESSILEALRAQEAKSAEEEKARADAEAKAKAEEIAQVVAELGAKAAEEAARQQAAQAESDASYSQEPTYCEPEPAYSEPESECVLEPTYVEEAPAPAAMHAQTIVVNGVAISYVYSYGWVPDYGAGVWEGSDSTTDGSYGYFVGHNPGSFWPAASIDIDGEITVCDCNGNSRTYYVVETFVVPVGSTWSDVCDAVCRYGESVTLQTCVEGGYRIVVAA